MLNECLLDSYSNTGSTMHTSALDLIFIFLKFTTFLVNYINNILITFMKKHYQKLRKHLTLVDSHYTTTYVKLFLEQYSVVFPRLKNFLMLYNIGAVLSKFYIQRNAVLSSLCYSIKTLNKGQIFFVIMVALYFIYR